MFRLGLNPIAAILALPSLSSPFWDLVHTRTRSLISTVYITFSEHMTKRHRRCVHKATPICQVGHGQLLSLIEPVIRAHERYDQRRIRPLRTSRLRPHRLFIAVILFNFSPVRSPQTSKNRALFSFLLLSISKRQHCILAGTSTQQ